LKNSRFSNPFERFIISSTKVSNLTSALPFFNWEKSNWTKIIPSLLKSLFKNNQDRLIWVKACQDHYF
jgi:hypothetical protein